MPAYTEAGAVITEAALPTATVTDPDPLVEITAPIYEHRDLGIGGPGVFKGVGTKGAGAGRHLKYPVGTKVRTSELAAMYPDVTFSTVAVADPATAGDVGVITGTNLGRVTALTFGGVEVTNFKVENDLNIRFVVPAGAAGNTVTMTSDGVATTGRSAATLTGIAPATGPLAGGTAVTITGNNLTGATGATIGGAALTAFAVTDDTTVTGTTPAGTAGAKDVVVTDDSGSATLTGAFTYA